MTRFPGRLWSLCVGYALLCVFMAAAAAVSGGPLPQPTPLVLNSPLETHALRAAAYRDPGRFTRGVWISSDGQRVAFFIRESPSSQEKASTFVVKDVDTDAVLFEKVLFTEQESLERSAPALERLARVRAWEIPSDLIRQREWKPMRYYENPRQESEFFSDACFSKQLHPKRSVELEGMKITYEEPQIEIWRRGQRVLDRRVWPWQVRERSCEQGSPSWLHGVFVSRERDVVVAELGFCGNDLCPEPPAALHVLRVPGSTPGAGKAATFHTDGLTKAPIVGYETESRVSMSLYAAGFPALSEDGKFVAQAETFADGERKDPNLLITVRRSDTDKVAWKFPVLEAGELSAARDPEFDRKLLGRIREVNAMLDRTKWVPLVEHPVHPLVTASCRQAPAQRVELPALGLRSHEGHVVLKRQDGTPPIDVQLAPEATAKESACMAPSRIFIDAAYMDPSRRVILLHLDTCDDKTCQAPQSWYQTLPLR